VKDSRYIQGSWVPCALPAVCLDISSAEAQLGQVHATWVTSNEVRRSIHSFMVRLALVPRISRRSQVVCQDGWFGAQVRLKSPNFHHTVMLRILTER